MTILETIIETLNSPYIIETKNYGEFWSGKSFILHDRGDVIIPYWAVAYEVKGGLLLKDSYIRRLIIISKNYKNKYHSRALAILNSINQPIEEPYIEPNTGLP